MGKDAAKQKAGGSWVQFPNSHLGSVISVIIKKETG
jgi:hypothetical protein